MDSTFTRVDHQDDPERCERGTPHGPCPYKALPGKKFCAVHGGIASTDTMQGQKAYLGGKWRAQIGQFAHDPEIKRLNQEIGIMRLMLDKVLSRCQTDNDLLLRASTIGDLIMKIDRLVNSCNALDMKLGQTISRDELVAFGGVVVELVAKYITESDALDNFVSDLMVKIQSNATPEETARSRLATLTN